MCEPLEDDAAAQAALPTAPPGGATFGDAALFFQHDARWGAVEYARSTELPAGGGLVRREHRAVWLRDDVGREHPRAVRRRLHARRPGARSGGVQLLAQPRRAAHAERLDQRGLLPRRRRLDRYPGVHRRQAPDRPERTADPLPRGRQRQPAGAARRARGRTAGDPRAAEPLRRGRRAGPGADGAAGARRLRADRLPADRDRDPRSVLPRAHALRGHRAVPGQQPAVRGRGRREWDPGDGPRRHADHHSRRGRQRSRQPRNDDRRARPRLGRAPEQPGRGRALRAAVARPDRAASGCRRRTRQATSPSSCRWPSPGSTPWRRRTPAPRRASRSIATTTRATSRSRSAAAAGRAPSRSSTTRTRRRRRPQRRPPRPPPPKRQRRPPRRRSRQPRRWRRCRSSTRSGAARRRSA